MSSVTYTVDDSKLKARIKALGSAIKSEDIMRFCQASVHTLLADHINALDASRSSGLNPNGKHYDANKIYDGPVTTDNIAIDIGIPGISRAYHDITITPTNGKFLTIPVNPIAYGYRVRDLESQGYNIFRPKGKNVLGYSDADNTFVALYALCTSVFQPQDPSLLPTDEEIAIAFISGAEAFLKAKMPS